MNTYSSYRAMRVMVFLVVCAFYTSSVSCKIHLTRKMTVKILNGLPNNDNPLKLRCQDGDTDKGMQTLLVGEDLQWKFHMNVNDRSYWWCHFYWGDKDKSMMVYSDPNNFPLCLEHYSYKGKTCYWLVKEDGFYSSTNEQDARATDEDHKGLRLAGWDPNDGPIHKPPPTPPWNGIDD